MCIFSINFKNEDPLNNMYKKSFCDEPEEMKLNKIVRVGKTS